MKAPKSNTTFRISTNMGTASQYADSLMTAVEVKGRTAEEKGEHYLQLSMLALKELAGLLENPRLSESEKAAYDDAYSSSIARYDDMVRLRDRLLSQKKSFRRFFVNLFVRESESSRFLNAAYWNYSTIKRTSEEINRRLLPARVAALAASGGLAENNISASEESPRDVVGDNVPVKDLPPNETLRGIYLDVHTEQEAYEALETVDRIAALAGRGHLLNLILRVV